MQVNCFEETAERTRVLRMSPLREELLLLEDKSRHSLNFASQWQRNRIERVMIFLINVDSNSGDRHQMPRRTIFLSEVICGCNNVYVPRVRTRVNPTGRRSTNAFNPVENPTENKGEHRLIYLPSKNTAHSDQISWPKVLHPIPRHERFVGSIHFYLSVFTHPERLKYVYTPH